MNTNTEQLSHTHTDFEGRKEDLVVRQSQVNVLKLRHAKLLSTVAQAHRLERQYGR
jgi:hypothetical protein